MHENQSVARIQKYFRFVQKWAAASPKFARKKFHFLYEYMVLDKMMEWMIGIPDLSRKFSDRLILEPQFMQKVVQVVADGHLEWNLVQIPAESSNL